MGFVVAAVATMRLARSPQGPDAEVLAPGALKAATAKEPVAVHGTWSAGGAVRAGAASKGLLRFANKRLSFTTDEGETTFDTPVNKVRMAAVPGFWRPQLDLDIGGVTHTIRFYPLWDLGRDRRRAGRGRRVVRPAARPRGPLTMAERHGRAAGRTGARPPVNPVRQKARFRRMAVLLAWWALVLIGLLLLTAGGPWWLILPVGVIGVLVVTNTIVIIRHTGPEEYALEPGRLAEADADRDDAVAVWATRSPRHGGRDRARRSGTLAYAGRRLTFTTDPATDAGADDPLADVTVLDAPVRQLELGPAPTRCGRRWSSAHQGTRHVLTLSPPFDLGAGAVGAVVAGAWWTQLAELGRPHPRRLNPDARTAHRWPLPAVPPWPHDRAPRRPGPPRRGRGPHPGRR